MPGHPSDRSPFDHVRPDLIRQYNQSGNPTPPLFLRLPTICVNCMVMELSEEVRMDLEASKLNRVLWQQHDAGVLPEFLPFLSKYIVKRNGWSQYPKHQPRDAHCGYCYAAPCMSPRGGGGGGGCCVWRYHVKKAVGSKGRDDLTAVVPFCFKSTSKGCWQSQCLDKAFLPRHNLGPFQDALKIRWKDVLVTTCTQKRWPAPCRSQSQDKAQTLIYVSGSGHTSNAIARLQARQR